jgi:hypothetical protein
MRLLRKGGSKVHKNDTWVLMAINTITFEMQVWSVLNELVSIDYSDL